MPKHDAQADRQPMTYIFGTIPPPIGGVAIFLQRRTARFHRERRPYRLIEWIKLSLMQRIGWMIQVLLWPSRGRFEFNGFETWGMLAVLLRPFPKEIHYWVHSGEFLYQLTGLRRALFTAFLRRVDSCYLASGHVADIFAETRFVLPRNTTVSNAFRPPPVERDAAIWAMYDDDTKAFMAKHHPVAVVQSGAAFFRGEDIYGTDLAVEMMVQLHRKHPQLGLIINRNCAGDADYHTYFQGLIERIEAESMGAHIHILEGSAERDLWPLLKRADLFIRPTNKDGDAISIREALMLGTPVIASDACPRPDGVVTFISRDANDLAAKVEAFIVASKKDRLTTSDRSAEAPKHTAAKTDLLCAI